MGFRNRGDKKKVMMMVVMPITERTEEQRSTSWRTCSWWLESGDMVDCLALAEETSVNLNPGIIVINDEASPAQQRQSTEVLLT